MRFKKEFVQELAGLLTTAGQKIAVAESVTAGLLQAALASGENATGYFQGGITAYNIYQKEKLLHLDVGNAMHCNCVSEQTAGEMALNVSKLFTTDWGIGITGYAAPVPEYTKSDLFACFAISFQDKIILQKTIRHTVKKPLLVQVHYVNAIFETLIGTIKKTY